MSKNLKEIMWPHDLTQMMAAWWFGPKPRKKDKNAKRRRRQGRK